MPIPHAAGSRGLHFTGWGYFVPTKFEILVYAI
jgi:hypothetical protein